MKWSAGRLRRASFPHAGFHKGQSKSWERRFCLYKGDAGDEVGSALGEEFLVAHADTGGDGSEGGMGAAVPMRAFRARSRAGGSFLPRFAARLKMPWQAVSERKCRQRPSFQHLLKQGQRHVCGVGVSAPVTRAELSFTNCSSQVVPRSNVSQSSLTAISFCGAWSV